MVMYPVQLSRSRQFEQERSPVIMAVLTPQCRSEIVVKENLAENDSLRDKETTMEEGEESEISMVSTMPNHDWPKERRRR